MILMVFILLLFSCITGKETKIEDTTKYYTLEDVIRDMKLTSEDFIKMDTTKEFTYPVQNDKIIDDISEALAGIYFNDKILSEDKKAVFEKYFTKDQNGVYKIVCEILKSRVDSPDNESLESLIKCLKSLETKTNVKLYNNSKNAENDVMTLTEELYDFYKIYLGNKIDHVADRDFKYVRIKIGFSKSQFKSLIDTVKNIYFNPVKKSDEIAVTVGVVIYMIVNKQDMNGDKPYFIAYDAYSNLILNITGKAYHDTWEKNVKYKVKNEGNEILANAMKYKDSF
jgi:hypothetical protein